MPLSLTGPGLLGSLPSLSLSIHADTSGGACSRLAHEGCHPVFFAHGFVRIRFVYSHRVLIIHVGWQTPHDRHRRRLP